VKSADGFNISPGNFFGSLFRKSAAGTEQAQGQHQGKQFLHDSYLFFSRDFPGLFFSLSSSDKTNR
jgi:hypothetical protein